MSDTPRTDENAGVSLPANDWECYSEEFQKEADGKYVLADFARQLERELNAAIDLLAGWCERIKNQDASWDTWDEWYKDACYRPGPLRELIDEKIKQIEESES